MSTLGCRMDTQNLLYWISMLTIKPEIANFTLELQNVNQHVSRDTQKDLLSQ